MGGSFSKDDWGAKDIPDLTGKVYVITGANTGKFIFLKKKSVFNIEN